MNKFYVFLFAILLTVSCGNSTENSSYADSPSSIILGKTEISANQGRSVASAPQAKDIEVEEIERKLIKTGELRFYSDSINVTESIIKTAAKKTGSYISDERYSNHNNSITIRVPFANFDYLIDEISKGVKKIDSKTVNVSDVTSEYIDVSARVKTKKELENRYKELLKKAYTVEDVIRVEKEIGVLRADIESMEGRMKLIESQASYSTLTVTFYTKYIDEKDGFFKEFRNSIKDGWEAITTFVIYITKLWAFILLGVLAIWGIRKIRKNRRNKKKILDK